jgi:exodeoxyribonuclease VII large subunit
VTAVNSPEEPYALRSVALKIAGWIDRLGRIWVEGQVTQLNRRPGAGVVFLTLRDTQADISMTVTCHPRVLDALPVPLSEGARVVVFAKPDYYVGRGTLSLSATEIRPVGLGDLLARIEHLRSVLAAEGVFDDSRKRPLPFLPGVVGLICGRASAAERDVLDNARRRWPAVQFRVRNVAVQGPTAVPQVVAALRELDADDEVEVIVVSRGGGSVEDLLPFSDEALVRAVSACRTPVVSAIGHEQDAPLLDLVADVRASTPTDAARRVVPDIGEELQRVAAARARLDRCIDGLLDREQHRLDQLRSRPVLAAPETLLDRHAAEVGAHVERARRSLAHALDRAGDDLTHTRARVRALSPAATMERGYAVVQSADGTVLRAADDTKPGDEVHVRLASGHLTADVTSSKPASDPS